MKIFRSPVQWYGGKGRISKWVSDHLPEGKIYVEPFCGAASVFWRVRERFPICVLNDIDGRIISFFRVLQDREKYEELRHRLNFTAYSRDEFRKALRILENPPKETVEYAWAVFVTFNMSFSGDAKSEGQWRRSTVIRGGRPHPVSAFLNKINNLDAYADIIRDAYIERVDAIQCIRYWDSSDTVFYLDPPYVKGTRVYTNAYVHETDDEYHEKLVDLLLELEGSVVLSGYENDMYRRLVDNGFTRIERNVVCNSANSKHRGEGRTECLWVKKS